MKEKGTQKNNKAQEPVAKVRRIMGIGRSLYIALPQPFIRLHNLKKGEKVPVICDHILKAVFMKEA
jgi:hypothetical protein